MDIEFKIGDKVEYIGDNKNFYGNIGEIVVIEGITCKYGVRFKNKNLEFHDLNGRCKDGYGWWCDASALKLISHITLNELQFADILTLRDGARFVVAQDYMFSEDYHYCDTNEISIYYNKNLKYKGDKNYDIMKVERAGKVIFEREDVREMTTEEVSKALGYKVKIV